MTDALLTSAPAGSVRVRALRSLLGGGALYLALFSVVHVVLALTTDGATPADAVCLVLVIGAQAVLAVRGRADLSVAWTAAICASLVVAAAVGLWTMRPGLLDETYSAWFLGAIAFDLLGIVLLGRLRTAWAIMAVIVVLAVVWATTHGMPAADGLGLVVRHVATLLVGTALAVSLRRSRSAFALFQALRLRRSTEEEASRARDAARRAAVEQVLGAAGPSLRAIAAGRELSADDRRQLLVLEGSLRDQIRTPRLVRGALRDSVDAARRRGINVLLMDEADAAPAAARDDAAAWLALRLDAVAEGGFVGRLRDLGDSVRATAVNDDHGEAASFPAGA